MSLFTDKTLLITGGTGSFGNAVLNRFLRTDIEEIRIFSRDEMKQDVMRHEFQARMPEVAEKIKFYIGDVRDLESVRNAMHGVDYIFHAAALKQVPSCEFFPIEAVKTNVIGTENVLTAAIDEGVKTVICLSTDKAAYPVNAMGTSKAMMEKVIVAKSRTPIHPLNVSAYEIFTTLKDEYNIWVCPNGGELADKIFRVGHIGALTKEDNTTLVNAMKDMQARGLL